MIDTSKRNLRFNSIMGLVYKPLSMLISFVYVPIVLNYLGEEDYGIWATVLRILSWINYFDLGIGNGLRNELTAAFSNDPDNIDKHRKLISNAYIIFIILFSIIAIIVIAITPLVNWPWVFGINNGNNRQFTAVITISFLCVCVAFILSLSKSISYSLQKAHICNLFGVIKQLFMLGSVWVFSKLMPANLVLISVLYGLSSIFAEFLMSVVIFIPRKELIPSARDFELNTSKSIANLGFKFFIIQIAGLVLFTTDNLIITNLFGPEQVTYYTTVNKLFTIITTLFATVTQPFWSAIRATSSNGEIGKVKKICKEIGVCMIIAFIGVLALFVLYKPIAYIWLGKNLNYPDGLIFYMALYTIVYIWCNGMALITNGLEIMKGPMIIAIIQGIINIPASYFLAIVCKFGVVGVLMGTIFAMLISAVITPIWILKKIR